MIHIHSWSVFEKFEDIPGQGNLSQKLGALGVEGLELFTLFEPVDLDYYNVPEVVSVHLPYALDWRSVLESRPYKEVEGDPRYFGFGTCKEEIVPNIVHAIRCAEPLSPAYGVLHAGNTDMRQVLRRCHRSDDLAILKSFAEVMNEVAKEFPHGEPPFRISFENLWWEGLTLRSPDEWRVFEDNLEFDNWGFTLDTGHLMNCCPGAFDEESAIDEVLGVVSGYPDEMKDRIKSMHLQLSTTAEYRRTFEEDLTDPYIDFKHVSEKAFRHAGNIDQHRPFSSPRVKEIVDAVAPDYVTHELFGSITGDRYGDLVQQTSLFRT